MRSSGFSVLSCFIVLAAASAGLAQCGNWYPLGSGMDEAVNALAVTANDHVIAGGANGFGSGDPMAHIARWTGQAWVPIGTGVNGKVLGLAVLPSGDIVAGGAFSLAGGVAVVGMARFDGTNWNAMGPGLNGETYAVSYSTGAGLLAAGDSAHDAGRDVFRWTGSNWVPVGNGLRGSGGYIFAIAPLSNGEVVAGGAFTSAPNVSTPYLARSSVGVWGGVGGGLNNTVSAVAVRGNGDIIVGGFFDQAASVPVRGIARWNGSGWSSMGGGAIGPNNSQGTVLCLLPLPDGQVIAGGYFSSIGGIAANSVALWDGTGWHPVGSGVTRNGGAAQVRSLARLGNGDIVVGGLITHAGSVPVVNIARFSLAPSCLADFDCSGTKTIDDIFIYLNAWFALDPRTDVDGNGVNIDDIFIFINRWFAGC